MDQEQGFQNKYYEEINLADYVRVILKRKGLILSFCFGAAIAAGILSFLIMPKIYKIDTSLEVGALNGQTLEAPSQLVGKINDDVYGFFVREKLKISEEQYPGIKTENPQNTNLIINKIESAQFDQAKSVLEEINALILEEHQAKIEIKKETLAREIELSEKDIEVLKQDIIRVRAKIGYLEEQKKNLEEKVRAIEQVLPYQQDPGTQFALFSAKEQLENKKQEIEDMYLGINTLENEINSFLVQINSLQEQMNNIKLTTIIKGPLVSEEPIKPRPLLNIVIAAILGIFIGVFLAFGKEWWDKSEL